MLVASLFPAIIGSHFRGALYLTQSLAFRSPCVVGEPVRAEVVVSRASGSRIRFETVCRSARDSRTLVDGVALALITITSQ
jgi:3-hydroxybutyryl-CoA dehydratase